MLFPTAGKVTVNSFFGDVSIIIISKTSSVVSPSVMIEESFCEEISFVSFWMNAQWKALSFAPVEGIDSVEFIISFVLLEGCEFFMVMAINFFSAISIEDFCIAIIWVI